MKKVKDPSIKRDITLPSSSDFKISKDQWRTYIDANIDYFIWLEDTERGKEKMLNIDKVPDDFREGYLQSLDKSQACAEYNDQKGYYEILVDYIDATGQIRTTFMKPVQKVHLQLLLNMAKELDAFLVVNEDEIIDQDFIDKYK